MAAPSMTANAPGNVRASASLVAISPANYNLDFSTELEGQVTVKNTPGGAVSSTRGVRVEVYTRYGTGPATSTIPIMSVTLPSAAASTAESYTLFLSTGQYNIVVANLDVTNAVTVEITSDTVDEIA